MATSLTSAVTVTSPKSMIPHTRLASAEISVLSGLKSLCTSWVRWRASRGGRSAASRLSCSPTRPWCLGRPASERLQLRQLGEVPQQRPPHQRVVELAQRPAEPGEGDPERAAQGVIGSHGPEQLAVEVGQDVHDAPAQRAVRDHRPRLPAGGGHDPRHGQPGGRRLDVLQHPDLDADHLGIGPQVGELHHVALVAALARSRKLSSASPGSRASSPARP